MRTELKIQFEHEVESYSLRYPSLEPMEAVVEVDWHIDDYYGADRDDNRSTPHLFVNECNVLEVTDDECEDVPITDIIREEIACYLPASLWSYV